jgi:hypothetical protein
MIGNLFQPFRTLQRFGAPSAARAGGGGGGGGSRSPLLPGRPASGGGGGAGGGGGTSSSSEKSPTCARQFTQEKPALCEFVIQHIVPLNAT